MISKLIKILVVLIMISGLAGAGFFWNETRKRDAQISGLNTELDKAGKRNRAIQKKYTQEKAKLGTCMRMKMAEESKKLKFMKQVKTLTAEKAVILAQKEAVEKKYQASLASQEKKKKWVDSYKAKIAKMDERYRKLAEKYKASMAENRQKTGEIRQLQGEKKEVESELKRTGKTLERSNKHNKRLCVLAEELVEKYREETRGKSDPFTKIGMVELEHLMQEYIKKIDKEKIIEQ